MLHLYLRYVTTCSTKVHRHLNVSQLIKIGAAGAKRHKNSQVNVLETWVLLVRAVGGTYIVSAGRFRTAFLVTEAPSFLAVFKGVDANT
jgi:hypothetical protein